MWALVSRVDTHSPCRLTCGTSAKRVNAWTLYRINPAWYLDGAPQAGVSSCVYLAHHLGMACVGRPPVWDFSEGQSKIVVPHVRATHTGGICVVAYALGECPLRLYQPNPLHKEVDTGLAMRLGIA